jgi:hypothetical protein
MNDNAPIPVKMKKPFLERKAFIYFFFISLIVYLLMSGHFLISASSLFFEGLIKGGYRPDADPYDNYSLWLGFLHGFASLCGFLGAIIVLAARKEWFYKYKVILLIPWVSWTLNQVVGNIRWGLEFWTQWLVLMPMLLLSSFVLFCVVKRVAIPELALRPKRRRTKEPSQSNAS